MTTPHDAEGPTGAREMRVAVWSHKKGHIGMRALSVGDRIEWGPSGWGLYREHERYLGTVVALTAKRVRITLDRAVLGSRWTRLSNPVVSVTPFTICVSPSRLSMEASDD